MSTLVSLILAAVLNFLGANVPEETSKVSKTEITFCENTEGNETFFIIETEQSTLKHENI